MTEHDYFKICIGFGNKRLNELRLHRHLTYTIACGYADPKKMPKIEKFMPLDGDNDVSYIAPPLELLQDWDKKFRSVK